MRKWKLRIALTLTTMLATPATVLAQEAPFALVDHRPSDASRHDIRGRVLYLEAVFTL